MLIGGILFLSGLMVAPWALFGFFLGGGIAFFWGGGLGPLRIMIVLLVLCHWEFILVLLAYMLVGVLLVVIFVTDTFSRLLVNYYVFMSFFANGDSIGLENIILISYT